MDDIAHEPETNLALATHLEDSFSETRRLRSDGWGGPQKAVFCRTLAETGVVTDACHACGMSAKSAYALRQRDSVFARAWEVALSMARERLADELLARSFRGSVDQIMSSEGAIVGERHHFDNKLAFAILRRLDRRAELGATFRTPPAWAIPDAPAALSGDWQLLLDALSEDRTADAELLLAPTAECDKGNEGNDPPVEGVASDSLDDDDEPEERERVWHDWQSDEWRTDFPAPKGFDCDEYGQWDHSEGYSRTLTEAEMAALAAAGLADPLPEPITIEEDEAARDLFFSSLASVTPASEPGSALPPTTTEEADAGLGMTLSQNPVQPPEASGRS